MDWAFYTYQPVVYLSVALVATAGFAVQDRRSWGRVAVTGLVSSILFFLVTNFAVWAALYPHTPEGLAACYTAAIPYLRNSLVSMALFGGDPRLSLKIRS